ncbi:MAG: hypothetical protein KGJ07_08490 [Patescibacteria group bacterium]|nr:hypothetical protein [Patescibacteria group bacterium]
MLLRGATLVSDPCPYCKGVRIMKEGSAFCANCGRGSAEENVVKNDTDVPEAKEPTAIEKFDQKIKDLAEDLAREKDHSKQQQILKSIQDILEIKEKLKGI